MHRNTKTVSSRATGIALAGLVAASTLALSACAERGDDDADEAVATTEPATPAPQAATPGAATPAGSTTPGMADPNAGGAITDADRTFLAQALAANQHELQAAQLGIEKAQSEEVRNFAQRMQQDHSQLGTRMQPLVQQAGISMAEPTMAMTELEAATGEAFDQAFMEMMVADHRKAVGDFEAAANGPAHGAEVRSMAGEALPTLRSHMQDAEALAQQIGVDVQAIGQDPAAADGTEPEADPAQGG